MRTEALALVARTEVSKTMGRAARRAWMGIALGACIALSGCEGCNGSPWYRPPPIHIDLCECRPTNAEERAAHAEREHRRGALAPQR